MPDAPTTPARATAAATASAAPAPNPGPATPPVAENPPAGMEVGQAVNKPIVMSSFPASSGGQNKFSGLQRAETLSLLYKHAGRLGLFKPAKTEKKAAAPKQIDIHLRKANPAVKGPKQIDLSLRKADPKSMGQSAADTSKKAALLLDYLSRPSVSLSMLKHASDRAVAERVVVAVRRAKQRLS